MTALVVYVLGCLLMAEFHAYIVDSMPELARFSRSRRITVFASSVVAWPAIAVGLLVAGWFGGRAIRQGHKATTTTQSGESGA